MPNWSKYDRDLLRMQNAMERNETKIEENEQEKKKKTNEEEAAATTD